MIHYRHHLYRTRCGSMWSNASDALWRHLLPLCTRGVDCARHVFGDQVSETAVVSSVVREPWRALCCFRACTRHHNGTPPEAFLRRTHKSLTTNSDPQRSPTPATWKPMQVDDLTMPERLFRRMAHPGWRTPKTRSGEIKKGVSRWSRPAASQWQRAAWRQLSPPIFKAENGDPL